MRILASLSTLLLLSAPASAVTMDWVTVGNPGNASDTEVMTCCGVSVGTSGYGAVPYIYQIAKYEVTNAQYAEFLNAVADTDTNGLYNTNMSNPPGFAPPGGITRTGSSGSYSYSANAGRENVPVNFVSFHSALRFANWLNNGQLTGAQDGTTTEDGAYTITALGIAANSITRNAGATIFLTSENEWYKAAYYDSVTTSYFDYPAGSDTEMTCASPTAAANHANCEFVHQDLTGVGSYTGSASPYGTFDQGGNLFEWNEAIVDGGSRSFRGGSYSNFTDTLTASTRFYESPASEFGDLGFRVAMIPEPGTGLLLIAGMLGLAGWRRGRA